MTGTIRSRCLLTAAIAFGALASAASAAQAAEKISVRIHNGAGHAVHVEVAAAREGVANRLLFWSLHEFGTETLQTGHTVESQKNGEGLGTWSSWVRAYTKTSRPDDLRFGCNVMFVSGPGGQPFALAGLATHSSGLAAGPYQQAPLAVGQSHTFDYEAHACKVVVVRDEDQQNHRRFDLTFRSVKPSPY